MNPLPLIRVIQFSHQYNQIPRTYFRSLSVFPSVPASLQLSIQVLVIFQFRPFPFHILLYNWPSIIPPISTISHMILSVQENMFFMKGYGTERVD